jgi:sensor c-di-GMP phosphodiesterase-like protein
MHRNNLTRLFLLLSRHLAIIWSFLTLVGLIIIFFLTLNFCNERLMSDTLRTTREVTRNFDGFIEDLFQEVFTLPLYGQTIQHCTKKLNDELERIRANNPKISGLVITNTKNQLICSTIPVDNLMSFSAERSRTILGPVTISLFDQPVYLVRQRIGPYVIQVLVLSSVLKEQIETPNRLASKIILNDNLNQHRIISLEHSQDDHQNWIVSTSKLAQDTDPRVRFVEDQLQSIEGITLQVVPNKKKLLTELGWSELFALIGTLFLSLVLFKLIKYHLKTHCSLCNELKRALKHHQFYPEYQLIYDCRQNTFSGAEVLLRWRHDDSTVKMPDAFIHEAERTGLIVPITLQLIDIAFNEFSSLLKENAPFYLSFNLSITHFKDSLFFTTFHRLQKKYGIPTHQILLEITERDLLDINNKLFLNKMIQLRELGYSLAIDDFGTGYASISYLQNFPFNYLKIDKIFVHSIGAKEINGSLNEAIIQFAKGLNLIIIAEGVETQEQVDFLKNNEVRYLQGWYYSKAVPITLVKSLIQGMNHEQTD